MKLLHRLIWSSGHSRAWQLQCRLLHEASVTTAEIKKSSDPLRILFCGADDFSIASLHAIDDERHKNPSLIQSIDVVCRPDKRTGRGLKTTREVPIKPVAKELHLPIHEIDSAAAWSSPTYINLIVAVSFGLLIPAPVINAAKYGGLNLHPSLLPDLRGSSPIHQTLLLNRKYTGVTLQTLHPTKFDRGQILAQTPFPGIPVPEDSTPSSLVQLLAPIGAELLVQGLRNRIFAPPVTPIPSLTPSQIEELTNGKGLAKAPKMTTEDKKIDWKSIKGSELQTRLRVHGSLWDDVTYKNITKSRESKRIVWTKLDLIKPSTTPPLLRGTPPGYVSMGYASDGSCRPTMLTADGECFVAIEFHIEGGAKGEGGKDLKKAIEAKRKQTESCSGEDDQGSEQ